MHVAAGLRHIAPPCAHMSPSTPLQDNPVVDDMKATLDYDLTAVLACPRWTDGFQHFENVIYEPSLTVMIDVRCQGRGLTSAG